MVGHSARIPISSADEMQKDTVVPLHLIFHLVLTIKQGSIVKKSP
jgi:hypothetical protein